MMNIPLAAAGILLLVFGRKLFWLLVGAAGFLAGYYAGGLIVESATGEAPLILGLALGLAGAVLAFFAQKIAIVLGGFLAGGFIAAKLAGGMEGLSTFPEWVPFVVGGIVGALLLKVIFEWTLIVLTSFLGAAMVIAGAGIGDGSTATMLTLIIGAIGIVVQARTKRKPES
jgi:hypothetical protein